MADKVTLYSDRRIDERLQSYEDRELRFKDAAVVVTGIATGIPALDEVTMGIQPTDLWVIQGRTGVGKTYFLCFMAHHMRVQGYRVLFVNREMEPEHVMGRIDALAGNFSYHRWRQGKLNPDEKARYKKLAQAVVKMPGRIDVVPPIARLTPATMHKLIAVYNPGVIIVDYLNRMDADEVGTAHFDKMRVIADALKDIAYRGKVPVIAAAQTNRAAVLNKGNVPGTEHLHGSDMIGWNADLVVSLFRTDKMMLAGHMGLRMVKYRHGEELDMILKWDLSAGVIKVERINNRAATDVDGDDDGLPE
jgi:replicative DNA helicase